MKVLNGIAIVFFATIIVLCLLVSYRYVLPKSPWLVSGILLSFNIFFVSLFFQLNGKPVLKVGMLTVGNILGLLWNALFLYLLKDGCDFFLLPFDVFYNVASPILNLLWIVPFWSISLSCLPKLQPCIDKQQGTP